MAALRTNQCRVEPADSEPVTVNYRVAGDGPPLVLLHGIGLDAAAVSWRDVMPALAENHRVYAPDLPGHGESEKPRVDYTTAYYEAVLSGLLDELDVSDPDLVGISMGGGVALAHALNGGDPERLVLVNSYGLGGDAYWRLPATALLNTPGIGGALWSSVVKTRTGVRGVVDAMTAGRGADADLVEDVYETARRPGALRAMRRWQRNEFGLAGFETNGRARLSELDVPTLLVHGESDPVVPPRWSREADERLPESDLHLLENSGHWVPRECPDRFLDAIEPFLAG